ncbi:MAG TPA: ChbG/HpnK family deacetylase [Tepidisphaeraceae bacterium]|jgi:hypothetical protein
MRIILNADHFGRDQDTFDAALECFAAGALSSATLLPAAPLRDQAIAYAQKHPEFSFGIHLDAAAADLKPVHEILSAGISLSHVILAGASTNQSLDELAKSLRQLHIKRARSAPDYYLNGRFLFDRFSDRLHRKRLQRRFITTDHLALLDDVAEARAMQEWMPPVTDESLEVGCIPGFTSEGENAHRQAIQSFARRAIDAGHHLITWNQL